MIYFNLVTMYQYWFINCDKSTILMLNTSNGGDWLWGIQECTAQSLHPCCIYAAAKLLQCCPTLCNPIAAHQASLSLGFSRQEYWSGVPLPSPSAYIKLFKNLSSLLECYIRLPNSKIQNFRKRPRKGTHLWEGRMLNTLWTCDFTLK